MKELDYGKGYLYAHDFSDAYIPQEYLPDELRGERGRFYRPTDRGKEAVFRAYLEKLAKIKAGQ